MKLSKKEQALITKVRRAVEFAENGDPIKDVMDDLDIREALELLVKFADDRLKQG
jgi:hypothetical protein